MKAFIKVNRNPFPLRTLKMKRPNAQYSSNLSISHSGDINQLKTTGTSVVNSSEHPLAQNEIETQSDVSNNYERKRLKKFNSSVQTPASENLIFKESFQHANLDLVLEIIISVVCSEKNKVSPFPVSFTSEICSETTKEQIPDRISFILDLAEKFDHKSFSASVNRKIFRGFSSALTCLLNPALMDTSGQISASPIINRSYFSRFQTLLESPTSSPLFVHFLSVFPIDLLQPKGSPLGITLCNRLLDQSCTGEATEIILRNPYLNNDIDFSSFISKLMDARDMQSLQSYLKTPKRRAHFLKHNEKVCVDLAQSIINTLDNGLYPDHDLLKLRTTAKYAASLDANWKFSKNVKGTSKSVGFEVGRKLGVINWLLGEISGDGAAQFDLIEKEVGNPEEVIEDSVLVLPVKFALFWLCLHEETHLLAGGLEDRLAGFGLRAWLDGVRDVVVPIKVEDSPFLSGKLKRNLMRREDEDEKMLYPKYEFHGPIFFVENTESKEFLELKLLFSGTEEIIVGIDAEWVPTEVEQNISIFQLAVKKGNNVKCYILDLLSLDKRKAEELIIALFENENIRKAGNKYPLMYLPEY
ncbi:hypothetical protein HK096_000297 [Nowakowskiella sp. JEL0078]|nr:hypothetical protein HK096_000297 [Nowakowskiella sp. JEL0078]